MKIKKIISWSAHENISTLPGRGYKVGKETERHKSEGGKEPYAFCWSFEKSICNEPVSTGLCDSVF